MARDRAEEPPAELTLDETGPAFEGSKREEPRRGDTLAGRYAVFDRIGRGGMGTVYRVEDLELHELVALKLLDADAAEDEAAVDQFRREVKLARRVAHRNVVRTYDYGTTGGRPFLTMEYVDGTDLRQAMTAEGIDRGDVLEIAVRIADGLAEAHRVGIIHRDLKPANVLVGSRGRIAISDFGIAGALRRGDGSNARESAATGAGTPAYMAPEQVRGREDMDHRVDVFAFGVLMFELLTGELPWSRGDPLATAVARIDEPAPSIRERDVEIPEDLAAVVDQCLRRDRDRRPEDVEAVYRRLSGLDAPGPASVDVRAKAPAMAETIPAGDLETDELANDETGADDGIRVAVPPWAGTGDAELAEGLRETFLYRLGFFEDIELPVREVGDGSTTEVDPEGLANRVGAEVFAVAEVDGREPPQASIRLVDTESGETIWSSRDEFRGGHVRQVAAAWAKSVGEELEAEPKRRTVTELDVQAQSWLMEGRHLMRERWYGDIGPALERLEAARDRAPEHPRTLAPLAVARARQAYLDPESRDAHVDEAIELARAAIDRAGDVWAEPRYALAMAHFNGRNFGQATATLRAALVRDPDFAEAHELLGRILLEIGPLEHGIDHLEQAADLNPFLYRAYWDLMRGYGLAGDWEAVADLVDTSIDSEYQRVAGGVTALRMLLWRDHPALREMVERERDAVVSGPYRYLLEVVEGADFGSDRRDALEEIAAEVPSGSRRLTMMTQVGTEMALHAGERDAAFEYLDRAIESGLFDVVWLRHCPLFDAIRGEEPLERRIARVKKRVEKVASTRQ